MPLFSNSSSFSAKGNFTDNSTTISQQFGTINFLESRSGLDQPGLEQLFARSIPGATHDSSDRYPPPLCHPGTRDELIEQLVTWGSSTAESQIDSIAWVKGPAGAGKSAVCQSSADSLGENLGASFFFSRPNSRSDPNRFFTTIAFQLAVKHEHYGRLLDERIRKNPSIITKSLPVQFRELIAIPIRQALTLGNAFPGKVIIIDGLDECEGARYQKEILDIIARSLIDQTTPFRWIIGSRLETHIVAKFDQAHIKRLTLNVEVTISRDLDPAIFRFLSDKLVEVREKHVLDESWPCEEDLHKLVEFSSGMFAYAHVISLFIDDDDSTSPIRQLRLVLDLAKQANSKKSSKHPLERLDMFYKTLILERLPKEKFDALRLILLVNHLLLEVDSNRYFKLYITKTSKGSCTPAQRCANILFHSEQEFRGLCRSLHAVMVIDPQNNLKFYHASFMDLLLDPVRSEQFCVWSADCVITLLDRTKQGLDLYRLSEDLSPKLQLTWEHQGHQEQYYFLAVSFTKALGLTLLATCLDEQRSSILKEWDFRKLLVSGPIYCREEVPGMYVELCHRLGRKGGLKQFLSLAWRDSPGAFLSALIQSPQVLWRQRQIFILGHGKKSVFLRTSARGLTILPCKYQDVYNELSLLKAGDVAAE